MPGYFLGETEEGKDVSVNYTFQCTALLSILYLPGIFLGIVVEALLGMAGLVLEPHLNDILSSFLFCFLLFEFFML